MGKASVVLICVLIAAIDAGAGYLGLQAQTAQDKVKHVGVFIFECRKKPSHEAFLMGLGAAGLLTLAHFANFFGGCVCIRSQEECLEASPSRLCAAAGLLASWIIVVIGGGLLVAGALHNQGSSAECDMGFAARHFLSYGGISCFFHALSSLVFHVSARAAKAEEEDARHKGHP
ncbi:protein VASCULATURE COMPLEXITY AND CONNECTIVITY-like [Malania oleifera]|uniref:protein VASCULATURE COMPLEXITY AND CONNECTIVITY-like n=1 Tax=Malania oleifera TaxID=397392 RepID=UPI0025AEAB87|nr:protein VASCULATURE COMPLEXITY AND CONNECTIVITY-like [Malania oleifera]